MLRLSNEVLLMVLELLYSIDKNFNTYGNKEDLFASRATCRKLADLGQSLAFKAVTFIQDEVGYKRLLEISKSPHVCGKIQRLACYFIDYEAEPTPEQFGRSRGIFGWRQENFDEAYEEYCRDYQHQQRLEDENMDVAILAAVLPSLRNLRSMRIEKDTSDTTGEWDDEFCSFTYSRAGQRFFRALTTSLSVSGLGIEELTLGSFRGDAASLLGIVQGLAPTTVVFQQAFGNLKRLKILLPGIVYHQNGHDEYELNLAGISALIQAAPLLEELRLEFDQYPYEALPPSFLQSFQLPRLQTLRLSSMLFLNPLCLVDFLSKHALTLKSVHFGLLSLQTGSWETVFLQMREVLTLDSLDMPGGFRRIDLWDEEHQIMPEKTWTDRGGECHLAHDRAIENFIQRKTDNNPFDLLGSARA